MQDPEEKAAAFFDNGYSCSQSILMTFGPQIGMTENDAAKVASAFGGGIARSGETCGAVSGSLMVLGLRFGSGLNLNKDFVYQKASEFTKRFESKYGSLKCKQLIKYDISNSPEYQAARESQVFKKICPNLVQSAASILNNMLEKEL